MPCAACLPTGTWGVGVPGDREAGLGSEMPPPVSRVRTQQFREAACAAKVMRKVMGEPVEPLDEPKGKVWLCWKSSDRSGPFTGCVTSGVC